MTEPILVKAGQHKVAAAFVRRTDGPYEDLIRPHDWSYAGGGSGGGGITTLPHLRDLIIRGPLQDDRHLEDAEPPEDLHAAVRRRRRTSAPARGRSSRGSAARRIAVR